MNFRLGTIGSRASGSLRSSKPFFPLGVNKFVPASAEGYVNLPGW